MKSELNKVERDLIEGLEGLIQDLKSPLPIRQRSVTHLAKSRARRYLEASVEELEGKAKDNQYNIFEVRLLANAATVLQQTDIAHRALALLRKVPDGVFWAGMITNFELPKNVPESLRTADSPQQLERQFPCYVEHDIADRTRMSAKTEDHLRLCLEGNVARAFAIAKTELQLEEVCETLAILGDFDAALNVARAPTFPDSRRRGVLVVIAIELFRRGRIEEFEKILAILEKPRLGVSEYAYLALGLSGRVPWGGYPYPDY